MSRLSLVLVAVAVAACGKDEPPPPPPPTAPATQAAVETAPPPAPAPEPAKPAADRPADAAASALPPATTSAVPELRPIDGTTLAAIPPTILAVGGTRSVDALADVLGRSTPGLPSEVIEGALARIKATFGLDAAPWFASDRPLRFAVPDPRTWPDGFLIALPLAAGAKLEPAMIPGAVAKGDGHWAKLDKEGRSFWLDRDGDVLLVSSHADLVKKLSDFPKALAAWTPSDVLVVEASVTNARAIFAAELAAAAQQTKQMTGVLREAGMVSSQLDAVESLVGGVFGFIQGLDRTGLALDPAGAFPRLQLSFSAVAGSPLAATITDLEARRPQLAGAIPADAWLAVAYDLDPSGLFAAEALTASLVHGDPPWSAEEAKALVADVARLQALSTGPAAFWVRTSGAFPFALESVYAVSDPTAARGALLAIFERLFTKLWGDTRGKLAASGAPAEQLPGLDPASFVRDVGKISRAFGVTPSLAPGGEGKADAIALDVDWSRMAAARIPAPIQRLLTTMIGPRLELALGAGAARYALAFGPAGAQRAAELTSGREETVADPWLAYANEGAFAFVALRPTRALRALADLPQLASKRDAIGKLVDDPLVLSGRATGGRVTVTLTAPIELVFALLNLR
ncbi:MAG: hypothetical protein IT385_05345 [Deltaproteobacteria bacterium]|nr:hypothetical protein [Deltaproteobacteria bacterium]